MAQRRRNLTWTRASLLGLPPEVRLRIYDHVWTGLRPVTIYIVDGDCDIVTREDAEDSRERKKRFPGHLKDVSRDVLALLLTCKMLSGEARPVLFEKLPFVIDLLGNTVENAADGKSMMDDALFRYLLRHMRNLSVEASIFVYGGRKRPCVPIFWHEYILRDIESLNSSIRADCVQRTLTLSLGHLEALTTRNCTAFAGICWDGSVTLTMRAGIWERVIADGELSKRLAVAMSSTPW